MRKLVFYKYQGTGNDFVMIDNREGLFSHDVAQVRRLCDRKFGIGADGLILIENKTGYDFEMVYFNADGTQSLCGNGSRCAVRFAEQLGIVKDSTSFLTIDGKLEAAITPETVRLHMPDVKSIDTVRDDWFVDTGSPHYVTFRPNAEEVDVYEEGKTIRYGEPFGQKGTNVNFVEIQGENRIFVRTYERGVENETLSCGTGVTACAIALTKQQGQSPVSVKTLGGELTVSYESDGQGGFRNVYLEGPAKLVFKGEIAML
ncbi:diaminopimelate epimerase [Fulvitalea axinellae]|uniref:Diaminopimelate epimerase n=1 Tax=Fulvitalea axinellae TaxID=1182444 RepID=A0AAU9C786_9BACT|nr:diaminopimelate epimerase [Fulvitalea axinellae]